MLFSWTIIFLANLIYHDREVTENVIFHRSITTYIIKTGLVNVLKFQI